MDKALNEYQDSDTLWKRKSKSKERDVLSHPSCSHIHSFPLHRPHSAAFPPLFAAKNHRFSTIFRRNLFGEDEYDISEFSKNAVQETIIL
ncbi:hypothetical protein CMV_003338 [Castanea mollissima]|uniref:Uncharacterized protein n=1 Tax=Castanea mollissima TaxID=60419 RepID=A0A8J4W322_9ROSI|nr:hypothetical protein CMV_003338 [Castanea mollissima]